MADLLPLETSHLHHFLAEFHAQPVHLEARPVVLEENLRRHRLPVPRRRCLSHQEDVGECSTRGLIVECDGECCRLEELRGL